MGNQESSELPISNIGRTTHPACPKWVPDESKEECAICSEPFSVTVRRHHCRSCGKLVCNSCSNYMDLPQIGFPEDLRVRVCSHCISKSPALVSMEKDLSQMCIEWKAVKLVDFAKALSLAAREPSFHMLLLEYAKNVFKTKFQSIAVPNVASLREIRRTEEDNFKLPDLMIVTATAEDLQTTLLKLDSTISGRTIAIDLRLAESLSDEFTELLGNAMKVQEKLISLQREEARYRECKANLEAILQSNLPLEFTRQVVELAIYYDEEGIRPIEKGLLERGKAKLELMEEVNKTLSDASSGTIDINFAHAVHNM